MVTEIKKEAAAPLFLKKKASSDHILVKSALPLIRRFSSVPRFPHLDRFFSRTNREDAVTAWTKATGRHCTRVGIRKRHRSSAACTRGTAVCRGQMFCCVLQECLYLVLPLHDQFGCYNLKDEKKPLRSLKTLFCLG